MGGARRKAGCANERDLERLVAARGREWLSYEVEEE